MLSATATLGLVLLWDVDGGLTQIDKYLYSSEDYIKVKLHIIDLLIKLWSCPSCILHKGKVLHVDKVVILSLMYV